jgi:hypothetical protein
MDFDQLKDKLATGTGTSAAPEQETQEAQEAIPDIKYQHYNSSRVAMCMTTYAGKKISFANYTFITADPDIIQYLDTEIDRGLNTVTKGKLLTTAEADPMKILKAAHFQEFIDAQANAAGAGYSADMGNTKSKEAIAAGPAPMSSDGVAAN